MDAQTEDNQGGSLSSDVLPFQTLDASNTYSTLQMLTSTQPTMADTLQSMPSQYIASLRMVNVPQAEMSEVENEGVTTDFMTPEGVTSQPELSITEETLLRNYPYVSQLQSLQPLVMVSQESSLSGESSTLLTTSDSIQPISVNSSQPQTFTPTQYMLVSTTQFLPIMSLSSQVTMTSAPATVTPSSLTRSSSSELLTLSASQLTTIMSQPSASLQSISSLTDMNTSLTPPAVDGEPTEETVTSPPITMPLGNLTVPETNQSRRPSTKEVRKDARDEKLSAEDGEDDDDGILDEGQDADQICEQDQPLCVCDEEYPESIVNKWAQLFKEKITPYFGYVSTLEEAEHIFHVYEKCTKSKFVGVKKCKMKFEVDASKGRPFRYTPLIICGQKIPFDGVPYYHGGKGMYYCHLGSKRRDPPKNRPLKNTRKPMQSKKVGCKAQVALRVVARFPEYKLKCNTEHHRLVASQTLSRVMKEGGNNVAVEWRVYVLLPHARMHTNHERISKVHVRESPLDKRLIGRICQLVNMGLSNTETIQKHVVHFAEHVLTREGMKWQSRRDICGSRQVWWYRKQMTELMQCNAVQTSKFMEMIREVEDLCQKHDYRGFIGESSESEGEEQGTGGKWKKRTNMKKRKCYEQQLKNLQVECITELNFLLKFLQHCSQVEVLARNLADIRALRKRFGKELNIYLPDDLNGAIQVLNVIPTISTSDISFATVQDSSSAVVKPNEALT